MVKGKDIPAIIWYIKQFATGVSPGESVKDQPKNAD